MLAQNLGYTLVPAQMRRILDEVTAANRTPVILQHVLLGLAAALLTVVSMFAMRRLIIGTSRRVEYSLRKTIHNKLLALDSAFYQDHQTGDLISRSTNDLNDVRTLVGPGLMYIPNSLSRLAFFIPVLAGLSSRLLLIVGAVMLVLVASIVIVMPRLRPLVRAVQEQVGVINARAWQVISGVTTLKLYTGEDLQTRRFEKLNTDYIRKQMRVVRFRGFLWPLYMFLFSCIELVVLLVGGREVISGSMSLGELLQFNAMMAVLVFPVLSLGWVMSLLQQGIAAMGRINSILDHPVENKDNWRPLTGPTLSYVLRDLRFVYPGADSSARDALREVNLEIRPGMTVGIVGTVGSGKSTLVNLLAGVLRPEPGMLMVNGMDIRDVDPESLFSKVALVPQESFLFSTTIAENILLGPDEVDLRADAEGLAGAIVGRAEALEQAREAAEIANVHEDIATFPEAYETLVGERGITLSGGQKQRVAIARAWRKAAPVVIFDDSLSSVDSRTEKRILSNLEGLKGEDRTLIVVSHRVAVLKDADVVYVLDEGRIAERGDHLTLMHARGLYYRLWELQHLREQMGEQV